MLVEEKEENIQIDEVPAVEVAPEPTLVEVQVPEGMVYVPAGEFIMGSDPDVDPMTDALDELPQHKVFLDAYFIDKHEVSNADYTKFEHQGEFKTPTLRNVALTAPYFHTGEFPTLESVIEFNNVGGTGGNFVGQREGTLEPLGLSKQEIADLIAFLETLTGELPPAHLLMKPDLP